jgi:hypothetical protein
MTDGRIARLTCTATVIARAGDEGPAVTLAEGLLRTSLPAALTEALDHAFAGDPTVYIARSVRCEIGASPASTADSLGRTIATGLADVLRATDPGSADIIRFPAIADYHAAFLAAHVSGDAPRRWYFGPLQYLAALPPPAAFQALAAEGHDMSAVLLALRRSGDLPRVAAAVGERALARTWPTARSARTSQQEWLSVATLALDLARALGWQAIRRPGDTAGDGSARYGPPDLEAVAAAVADQARQAAEELDWTDPVTLATALARATWLLARPGPPASPVTAGQLPSWLDWADTPTLLAALAAPPRQPPPAGAAEGPLPPRQPGFRPPRTAAVEALLAALTADGTVVLEPGRPVTSAIALWTAVTDRMPGLAQATWPRGLVTRFVSRELAAHGPYPRLASLAASDLVRRAPTGPAAATHVDCAGVYLLLRTLDAIRMPALCRQAGIPPAALLHRLARRWSAPAITAAGVSAALHPLTGAPGTPQALPAAACQRLLEETEATARAQRPDGRGSPPPDAPADLAHAHDMEPETDLTLDLIALTVLRCWSCWLHGFAGATPGYLLDTFIRRPGLLMPAGDGTLVVTLRRQPHDIALDTSGALAAVDLTWPWPPAQPPGHPAGRPVRLIELALAP